MPCVAISKGGIGKGLFYFPYTHLSVVYFDADWADDPLDHCSISRYCTLVGG